MEPATAHDLCSGFRLLPVALHNTITAGHNFADGLTIARQVIAFRVHHPNFDSGNGVAGHRLPGVTLIAFPLRTRPGLAGGEHGRGFSEAVAGITGAAEFFFY